MRERKGDFGLRISDCGLRISDCGFRIADFGFNKGRGISGLQIGFGEVRILRNPRSLSIRNPDDLLPLLNPQSAIRNPQSLSFFIVLPF